MADDNICNYVFGHMNDLLGSLSSTATRGDSTFTPGNKSQTNPRPKYRSSQSFKRNLHDRKQSTPPASPRTSNYLRIDDPIRKTVCIDCL